MIRGMGLCLEEGERRERRVGGGCTGGGRQGTGVDRCLTTGAEEPLRPAFLKASIQNIFST